MMIDVFNHFMPKAYFDRLGDLIPGHVALTAFPRLPTLCDLDARLALLDQFDGLQQVLSLANPPLDSSPRPTRRRSSRASPTTRWRRSVASIPIAFRPSSPRCR